MGFSYHRLNCGVEIKISREAQTVEIRPSPLDGAAPNLWGVPPALLPAPGVDVAVSDSNAWLPGEMIDRGMEWLQALFASDLEAQIPSGWDW